MNNKTLIIFGLLGIGLLFLLTQKSNPVNSYSGLSRSRGNIRLVPSTPTSKVHQYTNEETWDIEWSEDGLPKKVTIHRNAVQT